MSKWLAFYGPDEENAEIEGFFNSKQAALAFLVSTLHLPGWEEARLVKSDLVTLTSGNVAGVVEMKPKGQKEIDMAKKESKPTLAQIQGGLFNLNKRLKKALKEEDDEKAGELRVLILEGVERASEYFETDDDGYAVQTKNIPGQKAAKAKGEKKAKAPKKVRNCPCCNEETGGVFKMGHDAKIKGIIGRIAKGKEKLKDQTAAVQKMCRVAEANPELSIKAVAIKALG